MPSYEPPSATREPNASKAVPEAAVEDPAAVPLAGRSSSAPGPDGDGAHEIHATEEGLLAAKARLRAESVAWGVREAAVEHIISHYSLRAARNILWKARRQQSGTALMAAAD